MSQYLVFQLYAPLVSWGEPAVGEMRHTSKIPSRSALLGLLTAALGIKREEDARLAEFYSHYQVAVRPMGKQETWLSDYHTIQMPRENKKRVRYTRRDELCKEPKHALETVLSTRDYRCDAYYHVAISALAGAPVSLAQLANALESPVFSLYLGRKSCPLALPLSPQVIEGSLATAFIQAETVFTDKLKALSNQSGEEGGLDLHKLMESSDICYWEQSENVEIDASLSQVRTDDPLDRRRWQFGERIQYSGTLGGGE